MRRGGGRAKINWLAARSYFATHPEFGHGEVARKFGVSANAVRKHAKAEAWEEYRASLQAEVAKRVNGHDLRTLSERTRRTLLAVEKARDFLLSDQAEDPKWSDLPPLVKLEQLLEGEATERIDSAQATALLIAVAKRLPEDQREEAFAELEAMAGGLIAIEGGAA